MSTRWRRRSALISKAVSRRLTIDLEDEDGADLDRLAEGQSTDAEAFARSLLTQLLRAQRWDSRTATELLDGIPGAFEDSQLGREQGRRGETIPLAEL
jgi:hypothetical protein